MRVSEEVYCKKRVVYPSFLIFARPLSPWHYKDTNKICRDITLNVPHISKKIVFPLKKFIRLNAQISPMLLYPVSNKYNSNIHVVPDKQQTLYLSLHEILSGTQ